MILKIVSSTVLLIFKQTSLPRSLYSPVTPIFSLGAVLGQFKVLLCILYLE